MEKKNESRASKGDTLPLTQQPPRRQLLNERAEKYLRESGNIEDLPDPAQEREVEKQEKENKPKE